MKRPRLVENPERPEESGRSKQKSRRRCFQCQTKLELVQQELGSCRCGEPPTHTPKAPSWSVLSHTHLRLTALQSRL